MNNKEKGDIKTPEEILETHWFYTKRKGHKEPTMVVHYEGAVKSINQYHDQFKPQPLSELSSQIESLQKELVVEKERLEKEKRQLLIYGLYHRGILSKNEVAVLLKITLDEVRVSIFEADLMIKEFIK